MDNVTRILYQKIFPWIISGLLSVNIWFLSQVYQDFKNMKDTVEQVKIEVSELRVNMQIMKDYELKKR